ncbi:histidine phosphatase superfamily [Cyathus striatus]|nr:histidine phosphatase superfamily [Cyathus striatus]
MRYAHLPPSSLNTTNTPFIRASSSQRVVDYATNWTLGAPPPPSLTISCGTDECNDTLDDAVCSSAGSSDPQTNTWIDTFFPPLPLTKYLNTHAPGANLTTSDVYNLMSLCPFETLAKETRSSFCALFQGGVLGTGWEGFEYEGDLDSIMELGLYGQPLGKIQGVGYSNKLLACLTLSPVQDHTQKNSTLDSSPLTFPLDRKFYADFSHDNEMIPIYTSIGLFAQNRDLDVHKADKGRNWRANLLVPFGAGMVVEKMVCARSHSSSSGGGMKGEYVRILANDALQPLSFCGAGEEGLCELGAFLESQGYARRDGDGDFGRCFSSIALLERGGSFGCI